MKNIIRLTVALTIILLTLLIDIRLLSPSTPLLDGLLSPSVIGSHTLNGCKGNLQQLLRNDHYYVVNTLNTGTIFTGSDSHNRNNWIEYRPDANHPISLGQIVIALGSPLSAARILSARLHPQASGNSRNFTFVLLWPTATVTYHGTPTYNREISSIILSCNPRLALDGIQTPQPWHGFLS